MTADSTIIIITNFYFLPYLPRNFLKGRRERGHEGAWGTLKAPAAAPPWKNPGSATAPVRVKLLLNCYTVTAPQTQVPPLRRSTLPRPVYESSFWTSKEVYETSHNR